MYKAEKCKQRHVGGVKNLLEGEQAWKGCQCENWIMHLIIEYKFI